MPSVFERKNTERLSRVDGAAVSPYASNPAPKKRLNQSGPPHPTVSGFFSPAVSLRLRKSPLCREWANTRPERGICPARLWWVS